MANETRSSFELTLPPINGQCLVFDGLRWVPTTYAAPTSTYTGGTRVAVDFGVLPQAEASFTVVDALATPAKAVQAAIAGLAPGKDADEIGMDSFQVTGMCGTGTILFYVRGLEGYLADQFNIVYTLT